MVVGLTTGLGVVLLALVAAADTPARFAVQMRSRVPLPDNRDRWQVVYRTVSWDAAKTAVIVCDMWDQHWCRGASARVVELAPRVNAFLTATRARGALVVHAPSGCMAAYADHPARQRARAAQPTELPDFLDRWNNTLDSERHVSWPIDQADGGCDCQPPCAQGQPWRAQIKTLAILPQDIVSDSGVEIGRLLTQRGIENVIVLGVHTNMCVLGRPFGLRNMVRFGKNVVLVRDLTDTMYNSRRAPYVRHVRGTELIIEHIEKSVCPTMLSSSVLGGPAFRFDQDQRPHVAIVVSDDHYDADKTLPIFAEQLRGQYDCACTVIHGEGTDHFPTMDELKAADVVVLFIRRLALPKGQLDLLRAHLAAGKPLIGLRTASHAFRVRGRVPRGRAQWPEFDAEVLGGNYHGHGPNAAGSDVCIVAAAADHPVVAGLTPATWHSAGSLYYTAPVREDATVLMTGSAGGRTEPLTWVRSYGAARVCYTALGHPDDFRTAPFRQLLTNAIYWCLDRPVPENERRSLPGQTDSPHGAARTVPPDWPVTCHPAGEQVHADWPEDAMIGRGNGLEFLPRRGIGYGHANRVNHDVWSLGLR
jgi:type 1 glutamine amidotransferase/nicotinamidase-related amidase